jgi:DUF4097 and DUF4098 domain-containing protein YvlB
MLNLAPLVLTVLVGIGSTDTTVSVKAGTRLQLDCFSGDIQVRSWGKDAVRVMANHSRRAIVTVRREEGRLKVDAQTAHGIPTSVDYQITVPVWMALELAGVSTDISVEGVKGQIKASSVNGHIGVIGGGEFIVVESVEGGVNVTGARGRIEASSINDDVEILDSSGEISAETVEGNVLLDGVDARTVEISSVNGSLYFRGPFRSGGVYSLSTHDGDVVVGMPERPDVAVTVATFDGDFSSSMPVKLEQPRQRRRMNFVLGSGAARLQLEAFEGSIRLENQGAALRAILERLRAKQKGFEYKFKYEMKTAPRAHPAPKAHPTPDPDPNGGDDRENEETPR